MVETQIDDHHVEDDLLFCSAWSWSDSARTKRIASLLRHDIDWSYLVWHAYRQGVASLLYQQLYPTYAEIVPKAVLRTLGDVYRGILVYNSIQAAELLKFLSVLEAQGLTPITLKGPVRTVFVYRNLAIRHGGTPIVLVHERDFLKAKKSLISYGYTPEESSGRLYLRGSHGIIARLRWELSCPDYPFLFDSPSLWQQPESLALFHGKEVLTLVTENYLLFLCAQGTKQAWSRLEPICDIANLIGSRQALDWERVMVLARQLHCERSLYLGLILANQLLDADLPDCVSKYAGADPLVNSMAAEAKARVLSVRGLGSLGRSLFRLRTMDRWQDKIRSGYELVPKLFHEYVWLPLGRLPHPRRVNVNYEPTPMKMIERMLELAQVGSDDLLYDLGCGDGRIVVMAAERYGTHAVGFDIDPQRISESRARAQEARVEHLVDFIQRDGTRVDLSQATVVTLYMGSTWTAKIGPLLQKQLRPGSRIVSRSSDMGNWPPLKTEFVANGNGTIDPIYLWQIE